MASGCSLKPAHIEYMPHSGCSGAYDACRHSFTRIETFYQMFSSYGLVLSSVSREPVGVRPGGGAHPGPEPCARARAQRPQRHQGGPGEGGRSPARNTSHMGSPPSIHVLSSLRYSSEEEREQCFLSPITTARGRAGRRALNTLNQQPLLPG